MKLLFSLTAILPLIFFASCSSTKTLTLQDEAPVDIYEYYYQTWVAGAPGGGSSINFSLALNSVPNDIILKDLYFMSMKTSLDQGQQAPTVFTGIFKTTVNQPNDITMDADPKKEYGNEAPDIKKEVIPFDLNNDEAVISYMKDGKEYYYKLIHVEERPTRMAPM